MHFFSHSPRPGHLLRSLLSALLLLASGLSPAARAGGGPENVLLVVNSSSWASMSLAHHYAQWRKIPDNNLLYVPWPSTAFTIPVDDFRKSLLRAILGAIQVRGLGDQIDCIIYSSDFPTTIDVTSLLSGQEPPENFIPLASITGMTYFWPKVQTSDPTCLSLMANRYMRYDDVTDPLIEPSRGFRSWYGWGTDGQLHDAGGEHYMLSAMLAVTSGRGTSVREAVRYLHRAAAADGTRPAGTIYFTKTIDERTQRRDRVSRFDAAAADLRALGVAAQVVGTDLPNGKRNVAGLTVGTPRVDWSSSRSAILPGAICDNFNFLGGILDTDTANDVETPLSVFLRHGAAGACGTIADPHGFPQKFPTAQLHVHYARGCTLAEAVYQSVAGPYQLLLVGDPLCRPWAKIPQVRVAGIDPGAVVKQTVTLKPSADSATVDRFQVFVDGDLAGTANAGEALELDTTNVADGHAEISVVGIENSAIETIGRVSFPVVVDNHGHSMEFDVVGARQARWGETVKLSATAPGAAAIAIYHGNLQRTNVLGVIQGDRGEIEVEIDAARFGYGPLRLLAIGFATADMTRRSSAAVPITLSVQPAPLLRGRSLRADTRLATGLTLTDALGRKQIINETRDEQWLANAGVGPGQQYSIAAVFQVPLDDIYQFQLRHLGAVRLDVDARTIYDATEERPVQKFAPVVLGAGLHRMVLTGRAGDTPVLELKFGSQRVDYIDGSVFQHAQ